MKTQHTNKIWILFAAFLTIALIAPTAFAQQNQDPQMGRQDGMRDQGKMHGGGMKHRGKMMAELLPPRMLLKHGEAIGLTEAQRTEITKILENSLNKIEKLRAELQTESDKLTPLLAATKLDTKAALLQADRVFAAETSLKRARLESMIQTKNVLTEEQVTQITQIRQDRSENKGEGNKKRHKKRHRRGNSTE